MVFKKVLPKYLCFPIVSNPHSVRIFHIIYLASPNIGIGPLFLHQNQGLMALFKASEYKTPLDYIENAYFQSIAFSRTSSDYGVRKSLDGQVDS